MKRAMFLTLMACISGLSPLQASHLFKQKTKESNEQLQFSCSSCQLCDLQPVTTEQLYCESKSTPPFGKGSFEKPAFSKPLALLWIRNIKDKEDFVIIEHMESGKTVHLGARRPIDDNGKEIDRIELRIPSPSYYDKSFFSEDRKITNSTDLQQKIADISWSNVYNAQTTGPIVTIDLSMNCQIQQITLSNHIPAIHMRCVHKDQSKNVEHNFFIYLVSTSVKNVLQGNLGYPENISSHLHEFCLEEEQESDL